MAYKKATHPRKSSDLLAPLGQRTMERYGLWWNPIIDPLNLEMVMIRKGGAWKTAKGNNVGKGLEFHYRAGISLLWPEIVWHKWNILILKEWINHRSTVLIGAASTGKTHTAAFLNLFDYYVFPNETTVIVCSTTRDRLEDRIWGEVKMLHRKAKERKSWIPGNLIEGKQRLVTDERDDSIEGRDFRNGCVGVALYQGGAYVGLSSFVGFKNDRVRLVGDELSLLNRTFVDSISNLDKNKDLKVMGLGNPKDTTDALGILAEPAAYLGGWEGGIDQTPITKSWETRRPNGVCVQLVGSDSPNLDGKLGIPLITQEQINRDIAFYGRDSIWFTMMDQGMMPRGQGSRRVITRQMCDKFGARNQPSWLSSTRIKIGFLDAAYRAVGGDRCIFGELEFGAESSGDFNPSQVVETLINQRKPDSNPRIILALVDTNIVPIKPGDFEQPEDQIVQYVMKQCQDRGIPPENFFFDSGMRTSLVTAFSRVWSPQVNPIDCGGKPSERKVSADIDVRAVDYYSKKITEIWFATRLIVEAGQMRGLTDEVMMEFCAREWTMVSGNRIEVEPKEKMKQKTGRSPDLADAFAIGIYGAILRGFVIRRLASATSVEQNSQWRNDLREKTRRFWNGSSLIHST